MNGHPAAGPQEGATATSGAESRSSSAAESGCRMADLVPDEEIDLKPPELTPDEGSVQAPAPAPAPAPAAQPSLLSRVASQVAQPFKDIGHGVMEANRAVTHAIFHPVETARGIGSAIAHPIRGTSGAREFMRGVNDNIPLANTAVQAIGGPAESSPEDAAAAPGVRAVGGLVGAPVGGELLGGIAAKVAEKAAPVVARAVSGIGESAEARNVARTQEALELKTNKGTRKGLQSDAVEQVIAENPELRKAAGKDEKVAQFTAGLKGKAAARLKPIYAEAGPADEAVAKAVANVDERIAELKKGDVNDAAAAKKLQTLRDEFNTRLGERPAVSASDLRAEQSAYQKNGYAKNINADPDVATSIFAQREMSKAVGDAVVEHVTGMKYAEAKAAAAADPSSLAAKLFKANDHIRAANQIDAGIADRAGRVQPATGPAAVLKRMAGHSLGPIVTGATMHSPIAGLATAAGQELIHAAPGALRAGASAIDSGIASAAPRVASAITGIGQAASGGIDAAAGPGSRTGRQPARGEATRRPCAARAPPARAGP